MEQVRFASHHGLPQGVTVRGIVGFVLTVLITALLWVTFSSTPASAAPNGTWNGGSILFDNHAYGQAGKEINKQLGLEQDAIVYSSIPQDTPGPNSASNDAFFIYFAPGVDPPKATSANYVKYTINGNKYTDARDKMTISLTPQGDQDAYGSSCSVSGIGWIICPVSVFMAESMDWLFGIIANFLVVKPLTLEVNASNGLYTAWNVMRTVANVAFVIAFLVIIYSQLTGLGITKYGMRKLVPRLVVAAILVNLSFYISAIAIDASNILGYSINNVFDNIRKETFQMTNDTTGAWGNAWTNITTIILAGGGVAYGIGFVGVGGAIAGLLPLLVTLLITLFVVLVLLAARQAVIILLVIVSPLAFVANLLPNTESLYGKWQKLFISMLVFFPAFALIFSGAQLAGQMIIMNANGNIITLLFGMAVQIAPLAITPIMFKLGGNLLSRIAQLVSNPNKGPVDRARKWADRKKALSKARQHENSSTRNPINPANFSRWLNDNAKNDVDATKAAEQSSENRRMQRRKYGAIYEHQARADALKDNIHKEHEAHVEHLKATRGTELYNLTVDGEKARIKLDGAKATTEGMLKTETATIGTDLNLANIRTEDAKMKLATANDAVARNVADFQSGKLEGLTGELDRLSQSMRQSSINNAVEKQALSTAQYEVQRNISDAFKDIDVDTVAGRALKAAVSGVGGESGFMRAKAQATATLRKLDAEMVKNIQDAADFAPGDLPAIATRLQQAINAGSAIEAKAYQNILLTSGGAGLDTFRQAIIDMNTTIPVDLQQELRDNILSNHGSIKSSGNDLVEWAAKGDLLNGHTTSAAMWDGISDKDFIGQHSKAQERAIASGAYRNLERVQGILAADKVAGNVLTLKVKNKLREAVGLPPEED